MFTATPTPGRPGKDTLEDVKDYYGRVLKGSKDLKTNACCTAEALPRRHREILAEIEDEILEHFYGCGSPIPDALEGLTVLDLGCGTGRDAYLVSKLVGPEGKVIGVDMTEEQLEVARRHLDGQMKRFGFSRPNVEFRQGYIEDLAEAGIADASVDLVISNCVVNLSPDKPRVLRQIFRVLRPGGELYFSDVFADRRVPKALRDDPIVYGECLGGALYIEDFRRALLAAGCPDFRVVQKRPITIENEALEEKLGNIRFFSLTVRAFKLESLEDRCEDYGQVATYKGTIEGAPHRFVLDDHHVFQTGKPQLVCGNTAAMLSETRFAPHFEVQGDRSVHYGLFDCGPASLSTGEGDPGGACC